MNREKNRKGTGSTISPSARLHLCRAGLGLEPRPFHTVMCALSWLCHYLPPTKNNFTFKTVTLLRSGETVAHNQVLFLNCQVDVKGTTK